MYNSAQRRRAKSVVSRDRKNRRKSCKDNAHTLHTRNAFLRRSTIAITNTASFRRQLLKLTICVYIYTYFLILFYFYFQFFFLVEK